MEFVLTKNLNLPKINSISGFSMSETYTYLIQNLNSAYLDHYSITTGSNLYGYIVPEAWQPISLTISDSHGKVLLSTNSDILIGQLVYPHSRPVSNLDVLIASSNVCVPFTLSYVYCSDSLKELST